METKVFQEKAVKFIEDFYTERGETIPEIYIVWYCKILKNSKSLLSTDRPDTRYFEITYNGEKDEFYLDSYTKELNKCIKEPII